MFKIMTILLFIGIGMLVFSSCTKTCVCEKALTYDGTGTGYYSEIFAAERGQKCSDYDEQYIDGYGGQYVIKCKTEYRSSEDGLYD